MVNSRVNKDQDRAEVVRESIDLISKKWHAQILYTLDSDYSSFSDTKSALKGISGKVLSESLSDLEKNGLVRKSSAGYCLTNQGQSMKSALDSLADWGERFSNQGSTRLLVIEDDTVQRQMYTRWLEDHSVHSASTESEAYEKLSEDTDVVLLDRIFDEPKGDSIAERIKEMFPGIEIVMITAVEPDTGIMDMEVDDYLVKPVERDELEKAIQRSISRSSTSSEKRKLLSMMAKKAALDKKVTIEDRESYEKLSEEIEEMKEKLDVTEEIMSQMN